ncbi:MAG: Fur family transcriptional regulator [Candidatus Levybacteria bacterium]|nr:Fur family transcriptional regulator [Candidatus Levybacteria bacterium]
MAAKVIHDCKDELREIDLRATPARIAVMNFLEKTEQPVDVNSVINYLNANGMKTDPATVFRMMNTLTQKGITAPIQFQEGKTRYELSSKEDHHHLICDDCGKIEDISDGVIPDLEKEIKSKRNFLVKRHSLEFFGLCSLCQH